MWSVKTTQDEQTWTSEYLRNVLASPSVSLPPHGSKLGGVAVEWFESDPQIAVILCEGGTIDDRCLAEEVVRRQLALHGYKQASFTLDGSEELRREAHWNDIMAKAKRLIQSGNVQLLRNGYNNIVAHVIGDHGEYNSEISRDDPNSRAITQWQCSCPWDQYAFQRTRKWKKYEGRPCAHILSAYWKSLSAPLDEDVSPGPASPAPPAGISTPPQPSLPGAIPGGTPSPAGEQMPLPGMEPPGPDVIPQQLQLPGMMPPAQPGTTPGGMASPPNAVSVPGAQPPNPANPAQYPGGTFSHIQPSPWEEDWTEEKTADVDFQNGMMARLNTEQYGIAEGKSEAHGAGQYVLIPANSIGEVLGEEPYMGQVDCIFTGPCASNGPLEPYHIRAWIDKKDLTVAGWVKAPGPAIKRR